MREEPAHRWLAGKKRRRMHGKTYRSLMFAATMVSASKADVYRGQPLFHGRCLRAGLRIIGAARLPTAHHFLMLPQYSQSGVGLLPVQRNCRSRQRHSWRIALASAETWPRAITGRTARGAVVFQ